MRLDGEPSISGCMLMGTCLLIFVWETASWNIEGFLLALVHFAWSGTFVSHGTEQALLRFRSSVLKENVGKILKYFKSLIRGVDGISSAMSRFWGPGVRTNNYYLITYCNGIVRYWARTSTSGVLSYCTMWNVVAPWVPVMGWLCSALWWLWMQGPD